MLFFRRICNMFYLLILINQAVILHMLHANHVASVIIISILSGYFIFYNIFPMKQKETTRRLSILVNGCELVRNAFFICPMQIIVYLFLFNMKEHLSISPFSITLTVIGAVIVILILLWNGLLRIIFTSSQLSIFLKVLLFFVWWIPVLNIIICSKCCHIARREYYFELSKIERNEQRKENEICKTNYPILLVHGIFWRDWQFFNYWGRIPRELIRNGATVYYGNQHSASSMDICAGELKDQILQIIELEQCEKVNIIAHSKGGLDARYVISCLDMDQQIASLTSIGTPHKGCFLVDHLLQKIPKKVVLSFAKKYNLAYQKLGDKTPDFYQGIFDLTTEKCNEFNLIATDKKNVHYQSLTSIMNNTFSAGFPLNLGYAMVSRHEGKNDGFVSIESSKHGEFLGCYKSKRNRGISHGDMIDLMRENIPGFDVCELYVNLVKGLKEKGF